MRAHLLTKEFFMQLADASSFEDMHSLLEQTVYRREINEAVLLSPERPDYDQAINVNFVISLRKIFDATGGEPHRLVRLLLSDFDVQNIKAILRGKRGDATPNEIVAMLVPVGELRLDHLEQIAQERDTRAVVERMVTSEIRYGPQLAAELPKFFKKDQDLAILELALDRYHFNSVMSQLTGKNRNVEMVRRMFRTEIDMRNLSTLVRIRKLHLEDEDLEGLCLPGGALSPEVFTNLARLGDVASIVAQYPDTSYRPLLKRALEEYQELDVVAFDKELEHALIKLGASMSNVDVLGIGVIIGYMWLKRNEVINLRIVLKGKQIDRTAVDIKKDLFFIGGDREAAA
jgi:V/A-type H+-transporting ATPase subunit C